MPENFIDGFDKIICDSESENQVPNLEMYHLRTAGILYGHQNCRIAGLENRLAKIICTKR